jgi:hypothetical protein
MPRGRPRLMPDRFTPRAQVRRPAGMRLQTSRAGRIHASLNTAVDGDEHQDVAPALPQERASAPPSDASAKRRRPGPEPRGHQPRRRPIGECSSHLPDKGRASHRVPPPGAAPNFATRPCFGPCTRRAEFAMKIRMEISTAQGRTSTNRCVAAPEEIRARGWPQTTWRARRQVTITWPLRRRR